MNLSRRGMATLLLGAMVPKEVLARRLHRETGYVDFESGAFYWVGGGRDRLQLSPEEALGLPAVRAVVPAQVADVLLSQMRLVRQGPPTDVVLDGWREDVMLSGQNGWIANNVIARPLLWPVGSSRDAWVVYAFDAQGRQWRMTLFRVCSNIALKRFNAPINCACDRVRGDACRS